jgi:DNA-binding response OmpR family regulator
MSAALVVDDEALAAQETAEALEAAGIDARWCSNPEKALRLAVDPAIALVITDLRMPGLDGLQLVEHLRAARPALPIVILTGHAAGVDREALDRPGVVAALAKPLDIKALIDVVTAVLGEAER